MAIQAWQELMRVLPRKPRKPGRVYGLPVRYVHARDKEGKLLFLDHKRNKEIDRQRKPIPLLRMEFLPAPKKKRQGTEA